jgi:2-oxoglutarate ferredoxin oxidoreductase subunit beta
VDRHRRRRRALDRRQPHDPHAAPQRRREGAAVQQQIYGLTKGQYSPTSEIGKKAKSTPYGSLDRPFNPLSLALGAEASFVARSVDVFLPHLKAVLKKAAAHKGSAFVEILQNCNIFNDGAWETITEKDVRDDNTIAVEHGQPLVFGKAKDRGIRMNGLELEVVRLGDGVTEKDLIVHDERHPNPAYAFLLSRMDQAPGFPTPLGVLRAVDAPVYETQITEQLSTVATKKGKGELAKLLRAGDTWEVR